MINPIGLSKCEQSYVRNLRMYKLPALSCSGIDFEIFDGYKYFGINVRWVVAPLAWDMGMVASNLWVEVGELFMETSRSITKSDILWELYHSISRIY